jgi:hypothetical protein
MGKKLDKIQEQKTKLKPQKDEPKNDWDKQQQQSSTGI